MATTPNRGWTLPDEYIDDWYNEFIDLITEIDVDANALQPANLVADVKVTKASPAYRLVDTTLGDWQFSIVSGELVIQYNVGTTSVPSWDTMATIQADGDVKLAKAGKGIILRDVGDTNDYRIKVTTVGGNGVLDTEPA